MISVYRVQRDKEAWAALTGSVLFTWHIFNPNGPTSSCVGLVDTEEPSVKEVFYRWLHFSDDQSYTLGFVDISADPLEILFAVRNAMLNYPDAIAPDLRMLTCVPSFLTLSGSCAFDAGIEGCLKHCSAIQSADWGRELYYLEKYDLRLFDRAGEEVREALEHLPEPNSEWVQMSRLRYGGVPTFHDWAPGRYSPAPFSEQGFEKWFARVTDTEYVGTALFLLAQAWVGAEHMANGLVPAATSLDDVKRFFAHFKHPLFEEAVTTEFVARSLGFR
jgi:hypothetical protein